MIKRCSNGHWYDTSVNKTCPHCKQESEKLKIGLNDVEEDDHTISIAEAGLSLGDELSTVIGSTVGVSINKDADFEYDDDKTISFGFFGMGDVQPVTGWLVCMTGEERGKDYRLHMGKNFIGRSPAMDVVLVDDKTISREKHCSVIYDPKEDMFYLSTEGSNFVYLNEELLETAKELKENDKIRIGHTTLIFIPFSRGKRRWEEE